MSGQLDWRQMGAAVAAPNPVAPLVAGAERCPTADLSHTPCIGVHPR